MGATSLIGWTDATVNFWWGCTKVGPGCAHCYAEAWAKRTGADLWGVGTPRRRIKSAGPLIQRLDNDYAAWVADYAGGFLPLHCGPRRRVFVQSMSDLFDTEVPIEWFSESWDKIERCDRLELQIVTKRISVVEKRLAAIGRTSWPKHAGLIITVVNQDEADRDIPRLLALKLKLGIPWVGLSIEPMLAPIDLRWLPGDEDEDGVFDALAGRHWILGFGSGDGEAFSPVRPGHLGRTMTRRFVGGRGPSLDWVIVGGESSRLARAMHPDWARSLRDQCAAAAVPFFFKQWGEWLPCAGDEQRAYPKPLRAYDGNHSVAWPDGTIGDGHHRRNGGMGYPLLRVGKKAAGRILDGRTHDEFPRVAA